jgi:hypothetical protein
MLTRLAAAGAVALAAAGCGAQLGSGETHGVNIPGQYVTVRVPEGTSIQQAQIVARQRCGVPVGFIVLEETRGDLRIYRCIQPRPGPFRGG